MKKKTVVFAKICQSLSLFFLICGLIACSPSDSEPIVTSLKRSPDLGTLNEIRGTYEPSCINRHGSFSLPINNACGDPANPLLSVEQGNSICRLTITSVLLDCVEYTTPGLTIDPAYHTNGTPFYFPGDCNVAFFANVLLANPEFGAKFLIKFIYSKNLADTSSDAISKYDSVFALVISDQVPAPDYTADTTPLDLKVDITNQVTQANGSIALVPGIQTGEAFIVVNELNSSQKNYGYVNNLFQSSSPIPMTLSLPASLFMLLNQTLPLNPAKAVIIAHTDPVSHITSYEVITIRFLPPTSF